MSKGLKGLSYGCLTLLFFLVLAYFCLDRFLGDWGGDCHLPDEVTVRHEFDQHRADFLRLVDMVNHDKTIFMVKKDGTIITNGKDGRSTGVKNDTSPEFYKLMTSIGIQYLLVREDRSVEFTMWGCGGAIMSDHYMGVRYVPKDYLLNPKAGWQQTVVGSIDSKKLPQVKGEVASGLYVVPVEPEWYLYRLEYQE